MELKRAALALLGGVALLASACTSETSQTPTPTTQPPPGNVAFANGGTVTVAVPYLPSNFNPSTPAGANRVTQMVMEQVWPQAFVLDPEYQPETTGFVDSAEVVGLNPMTVIYQIDPKASWSDGEPITATDFSYNWQQQLLADPRLPSAGVLAGYRDIKSISGSDGGKTVTVVFTKPYADWEGLFSNLIPAHVAQRAGWVAAFAGFNPVDVISGGPFVVSGVDPGKSLVLTRNEKYWGRAAHVRKIVFLVEKSDNASLSALESGSVSIAELSPGPPVESAIARAGDGGRTLSDTTTPSPVLWQLVFNLNDPVVGNTSMRKALDFATDPDELVADSVDLVDPLSVDASSHIFGQGQPGSATGPAPGSQYNPIAAATLLESLGYVPDARGDLRAYGVSSPLTLTLSGPQGNGVIHTLELQLQAEWAASGIHLAIRNVPMDDLLDKVLPNGTYQLALAPYVMPAFPSWDAIVYTDPVLPPSPPAAPSLGVHSLGVSRASGASGSAGANGGADVTGGGNWLWSLATPAGTEPGASAVGVVTRNVTGLDDRRVGDLFEEALSQLNASRQTQLLSKLDSLLSSDLPTLPLFQSPVSLVQQADIVNVSESPTWAGPLWDAQDWAIELPAPTG